MASKDISPELLEGFHFTPYQQKEFEALADELDLIPVVPEPSWEEIVSKL